MICWILRQMNQSILQDIKEKSGPSARFRFLSAIDYNRNMHIFKSVFIPWFNLSENSRRGSYQLNIKF